MITITGNVLMKLEEANYYNGLEQRDKAMPAVWYAYEYGGVEKGFYKCPVCGAILSNEQAFCSKCGQRIDQENEAL